MKNIKCPTCGQPINRKEQRMAVLKSMGINTDELFSLSFTDGSVISSDDFDTVTCEIEKSGDIGNSHLFRRWITAQTFQLLGKDLDWTKNYNNSFKYNFKYQFDAMLKEISVLRKIEKSDKEYFEERSQFFTLNVIKAVVNEYKVMFDNHLNSLVTARKLKKCKGQTYIRFNAKNIFIDEVGDKIRSPITSQIYDVLSSLSYEEIEQALKTLVNNPFFVTAYKKNLPAFTDAFKKAGCFYTLQNLFRFHDVTIDGKSKDESLNHIRQMLNAGCTGFQFLGLLKQVIKDNDFDLVSSIEDHR